MVRISSFLKELSEDNKYKVNIPAASVQQLISLMKTDVTIEKAEFILNLAHFHMNMFASAVSPQMLGQLAVIAADCLRL